MNVGTVEAKFAVDVSDLDKLPTQAQAAMRRTQQEFEKAAKGITAAFQGVGSGIVDQFGKPAPAAEKAAGVITAAWKRGADAFGAFVQNVKQGASNVTSSFGGMGESAKHILEIFAGFSLANVVAEMAHFVKEGISELTKMGFEAQRAEESFRRTTEMIGVNAEALAAALKTASREVVDQSDIMIASSKALAQGLAPEQLTKLMEVATARATLAGTSITEAFNNITTAVTTQQIRALKTMGIVIDLARVYDAYAQKLGTVVGALTEEAKSRALADEVVAKSARTQGTLTAGVLTNAQQVEKAQATWHNFGEEIGKVFATASGNFQKNSADMITWFRDTASWLDELGAKWNNYMLQKGRALGLPTGLSPKQTPHDREAVAADDAVMVLGQIPKPESVKLIEDIAHALGMANEALLRLSSAQATGAISSAQYAAGLQTQLAALEAVKQPTDDVKHKILELQAAVAGANFSVLQQGLSKAIQAVQGQEAILLATVKQTVAAGTSTVEQGAVQEANIHVAALKDQQKLIAQAMVSTKEGSIQRVQLEQQGAAVRTQIQVAEIGREAVLRGQQQEALRAVFAARSQAFEASLADDLNAVKQFQERELAILQVTGPGTDAVGQATAMAAVNMAAAQVTFDKTEALLGEQMADTVRMYTAGLFPTAQAYHAKVYELAQRMNAALKALGDARVTTETAQFAAILAAAIKDEKAVEDAWKAAADARAKTDAANVLGTSSSQGRTAELEIAERKKQIEAFVGFAADKEGLITQLYLKESQERMRGFKTETDDRKAQQLVEQEFMLKTEEQRNTIDGRIAAAAAATWSEQQFAAGNYFTFLTSQFSLALAAASDFYSALKTAGQDAARAVMTGFSDLFFDLFTGQVKSLGDVFKNFGLSMVRVLANFLASEAVAGLLSLFKWLIGGMGGSFDSGGLLGSILAGAGALFSSGGGGSGGTGPSSVSSLDGTSTTSTAIDTLGNSVNATTKTVQFFGVELGKTFSVLTDVASLGFSIYGLVNSIQNGNVGGSLLSGASTILSGYSLIARLFDLPTITTLFANALSTIAPTFASWLSSTLATVAPTFAEALAAAAPIVIDATMVAVEGGAAGVGALSSIGAAVTDILASIAPFVAILSAVAAVATPILALVSLGLTGMASDAEDAAKMFREQTDAVQYTLNEGAKSIAIFSDLGHQLDASHLNDSLHVLHDTLRDLGNLDLAVGLNQAFGDDASQEIMGLIPGMRAAVSGAWLAALDAAFKQGLDITPGAANAPNSIGETLQSPYRVTRPSDINFQGDPNPPSTVTMTDLVGLMNAGSDSTDSAIMYLAHVLEVSNETAAQWVPLFSDWVRGEGVNTGNIIGGAPWEETLWRKIMTPEHLAQIQAHSGMDVSQGILDVDKINALLDREFLTTTLRNAVVDVGNLFGIAAAEFEKRGLGLDVHAATGLVGDPTGSNWHGTPGAGDMPSVQTIADVQAALEAAGFTPGEYVAALEAYLTSIDTNLIDNPMWKKFTDALHGGTADVQEALNAAIVSTMTPLKFYGAAKVATDNLVAEIKSHMTQQANMISAGDAQENIDIVGKQIEAMQAAVKAWAGLVQLYTSLPVEMAQIAADLEGSTQAAIDAWKVQVQSFADGVAMAQTAFDAALAGGNVVDIQATAQTLHDQTINAFQTMLKAIESVNAILKGVLDQTANLITMFTSIAQWDIAAHGSFVQINKLMGFLGSIAGTGGSGPVSGMNLWAVDQALKAIIATLPAIIAKFGAGASAPQITGAVAGAAAPFLGVQQNAIDQATGPQQLALLQQQAQQFNALAQAAIAGVTQWAQVAIAGARTAADEEIAALTTVRDAQLAAIDLEITGIQNAAKFEHDARMAEIEAIQSIAQVAHDARMAEIEAIQSTAQAAQEARAAEMQALSEQIAKAQELESAVESMGKFIAGLKQGPLGPGNTADKATMAQDAFAKALLAFNANPTAGGLTDLQGLAQTMLQLKETVLTKPNPVFQALAATTIKQLEAAKARAASQMTDSQVLKAQLAVLQAADKAATKGTADQIAAIQAADKAAAQGTADQIAAIQALDKSQQEQATALIDTLNDQKKSITDDFTTQTKAIEDAFVIQKKAIEDAATAEIEGINQGVADALEANFARQLPLLQAQYDSAQAQLAAIGSTTDWQSKTLGILGEIRDKLALAVGGIPGAKLGADIAQDGLVYAHAGERILSASDVVAMDRAPVGNPSPIDPRLIDPITSPMPRMSTPDTNPAFVPPAAAHMSPSHPGLPSGSYGTLDGGPNQWWPDNDSMASNFAVRQFNAEIHALLSHVRVIEHGHATADDTRRLAMLQTGLARAIVAQKAALTPRTPPETPLPSTPPGPAWLSRTQDGTKTANGLTLVIEKGAIVVSGVKDPEAAAELAVTKLEKKLEERLLRGDLGMAIVKRSKP